MTLSSAQALQLALTWTALSSDCTRSTATFALELALQLTGEKLKRERADVPNRGESSLSPCI